MKEDIMAAFLQNICVAIVFHVAVVLLLLCCSSCSTHRAMQDTAAEGSTRRTETRTDAARLVDSVFVFWRDTVLLRGDTTEVTRWRTQYVTRTSTVIHADTLILTDTLRLTEHVETAATLSWYQRLRLTLFYPLFIALALSLFFIYAQRRS